MNKKKNAKFGSYYYALSNYEGYYDFPVIGYHNVEDLPDYLCFDKDRKEYHKTQNTAVCFFEDDSIFDGQGSLYDAIYHDSKRALKKFKERYKDIKFVIQPDYSTYIDMPRFMSINNIGRARLVCLWFRKEINAKVIPLLTFSDEESLKYCMDGIEEGSIVCLSLKGIMRDKKALCILKKLVVKAVDEKKVKAIIVYSIGKDENTLSLFKYASSRGVKIVIPSNRMRERRALMNRGNKNGQR